MSLYIIEDDYGNVLTDDGDFDNTMVHAALYDETVEPALDIERYGGHVVTLVEEPKKAKLPKKAAEWIDSVKDGGYDITYIFTEYAMPNEVSDWLEDSDDDAEHREERGLMLINAYLYGYTVEKEKKYYVKVPHTEDVWYYKGWGGKLETIGQYGNKHRITFTESEIEHYGLQDCEKVECD